MTCVSVLFNARIKGNPQWLRAIHHVELADLAKLVNKGKWKKKKSIEDLWHRGTFLRDHEPTVGCWVAFVW